MPETTRKTQTFIHGASILIFATAITKILGAIYKIPLGWLIDETAMGYFTTAYDIYLPIYSLAMAGLPVAVSRMVSQRMAEGRFRDVRQTFHVAKRAFMITGAISFVLLIALSYPYVMFNRNFNAIFAIWMIAPSVLFCCITAAYRGYYEGLRNMTPTAISNVIESAGKMVLGLGSAYTVMTVGIWQFNSTGYVFGQYIDAGTVEAARVVIMPFAAAGAILGVTLGTLVSAIFMSLLHRKKGDRLTHDELISSPEPLRLKKTLRLLLAISIPVAIGSLATQIGNVIDVLIVQRRVNDIAEIYPQYLYNFAGEFISEGQNYSTFLYGIYRGFVFTIFNMILPITALVGVSALPTVTAAWVSRDRRELKTNIESTIKLVALIALPAALGMIAIPQGILSLLYNREGVIALGPPMLRVMGIALMFCAFCLPMGNMLQAIGKPKIPVRNILLGAVVKAIVTFWLVGNPNILIMGAPLGTLACFIIIFSLNLYALCKHSKAKPNLMKIFIKPLFCAVLCGVAAWASVGLLPRVLELPNRVNTIIGIVLAGLVYVAALALTRTITRADIKMFPKGEKILKLMARFKVIS